MGLRPGDFLGHYEIVALLGAGGMGEVYRARDTRLGRDVALKLVLTERRASTELTTRFEREAKALASLNHRNVATLHGFEHDGETSFLVMEMVEGETLEERLARGPIRPEEIREVFGQIASGLEAAHRRGIVHRDLKPANIKVSQDGQVKILDFGLARIGLPTDDRESTMSDQETLEATVQGKILGTIAYMSPEQARGETVSRATDIWAFGVCLYEALIGARPFRGNTSQETMAAILRDELDSASLAEQPESFRRVVRRCLHKDRAQRLRDIGDAGLEIEEADLDRAPQPPRESARRPLWHLVAAGALAILTGVGGWLLRGGKSPDVATASRWFLPLESANEGHLSLAPVASYIPISISPDGSVMAFSAYHGGSPRRHLFMRPVDQEKATLVPGSENASVSFFSPDGRWLAFQTGGRLMKTLVDGGAPAEIGPSLSGSRFVWGPRGQIVFAAGLPARILSIDAAGGEPTVLDLAPSEVSEIVQPVRFLDDDSLLILAIRSDPPSLLQVLSVTTGERRTLLQVGEADHAELLSTGHVLYWDRGTLLVVALDQQTREPLGEPVPLPDSVNNQLGYWPYFAAADNGTAIYMAPDQIRESELVWVDRQGTIQSIPNTSAPFFGHPVLSPSGREAVVSLVDGIRRPLWVFDLERGTRRKLLAEGRGAIWSPDGANVVFQSEQGEGEGLYIMPANGSGEAELLISRDRRPFPQAWLDQGRSLAFREVDSDSDVYVLADSVVEPLLSSPFEERDASFSPDGRYVVFRSNESGSANVHLQATREPSTRIQVSSDGGYSPHWGSRADEILYRAPGGRMMAVSIRTTPELGVGTPRLLFQADLSTLFDISPDGQRFLMMTEPSIEIPTRLHVVINWLDQLERLAPTGRRSGGT